MLLLRFTSNDEYIRSADALPMLVCRSDCLYVAIILGFKQDVRAANLLPVGIDSSDHTFRFLVLYSHWRGVHLPAHFIDFSVAELRAHKETLNLLNI
jgi:hypothetical protein